MVSFFLTNFTPQQPKQRYTYLLFHYYKLLYVLNMYHSNTWFAKYCKWVDLDSCLLAGINTAPGTSSCLSLSTLSAIIYQNFGSWKHLVLPCQWSWPTRHRTTLLWGTPQSPTPPSSTPPPPALTGSWCWWQGTSGKGIKMD